MTTVLVLLAVAAGTGLLAWMLTRVKQPENITSSDGDASTTDSDQLYRSADRPAGPDAEDAPTPTPNRTEPEPPPSSTD
jgi:hypothetical protein